MDSNNLVSAIQNGSSAESLNTRHCVVNLLRSRDKNTGELARKGFLGVEAGKRVASQCQAGSKGLRTASEGVCGESRGAGETDDSPIAADKFCFSPAIGDVGGNGMAGIKRNTRLLSVRQNYTVGSREKCVGSYVDTRAHFCTTDLYYRRIGRGISVCQRSVKQDDNKCQSDDFSHL